MIRVIMEPIDLAICTNSWITNFSLGRLIIKRRNKIMKSIFEAINEFSIIAD